LAPDVEPIWENSIPATTSISFIADGCWLLASGDLTVPAGMMRLSSGGYQSSPGLQFLFFEE